MKTAVVHKQTAEGYYTVCSLSATFLITHRLWKKVTCKRCLRTWAKQEEEKQARKRKS